MDESSINRYITDTFEGVDVVVATGGSFFFYNPDRTAPPDHRLPFATLVHSDEYDSISDLNRPSIFRLNISINKRVFTSLLGAEPSSAGAGGGGSYDFTTLDRIMPHPVYGKMSWICVLNPSESTFQAVRPLLAEAYESAVARYEKRRPADECA